MWRQIPWVANGLTVQGGLELAWGLALLFAGADSDTKAPATLYEQLLKHVGPPVLLVCGSVKAFAANRNRRFRGRGIGVVALWSAVPTAAVWLCAPSGLALLAYGSIVYRDRLSLEAFALGESERIHQLGPPPEEQARSIRFSTMVRNTEATMLHRHPLFWNRTCMMIVSSFQRSMRS